MRRVLSLFWYKYFDGLGYKDKITLETKALLGIVDRENLQLIIT